VSSELDSEVEQSTGRVEAFSDGVIAIAITLLVLEIHVPHVENQPGWESLGNALLSQWPSYAGYVMSFVTIGLVWANHHNMFRYIRRPNHFFLLLNVLFLMGIALFPFPTELLAVYIKDPDEGKQRLAVVVYTGVALLTACLYLAVWEYASRNRRLIDPRLGPHLLKTITVRNRIGPLLFGACFVLAFVNVWASLGLFILIAVLFLVSTPQVFR